MAAKKYTPPGGWYAYEKAAAEKGYSSICGIDEAGRGPLAGPVFAAAVILPCGTEIEGLNDSKKLTEKKREELFDKIQETAIACSIAFATEQEIDEVNILQATFLAMRRAVDGLKVRPDFALVDGNRMPPLGIPAELITLEILEGLAVGNMKEMNERISQLQEEGFRVSMDDVVAGDIHLNTPFRVL